MSPTAQPKRLAVQINTPAPAADVLVLHNIAWSHYKASVFRSLAALCERQGVRLLVVDLAQTERRRASLGTTETLKHDYPHLVLWPGSIEETTSLFRAIAVLKTVWRQRPKVLIVSGYYELAYVSAMVLGKLMRAKIIVSVDSTEADKPRKRVIETVKRIILKLADGIFGYGSRSRDYCVKLGVDPQRIIIRCQATDHQRIEAEYLQARAPDSSWPKAFIFVGRLSEEKNIQHVISAFAAARHRRTHAEEWRLILVGDGPLRATLEAEALRLGLPVDFVGGVPWYEVPRHLARADVLILPSTSEPWGLVVNEAMICEKAVIVSAACGCAPDLVIDGATGFQFDPADKEQLTNIMVQFIDHPGLAANLGRAGRVLIESFTPDNAASQMMVGINRFL
jgi:glycosyltransferase involved in cell wall biosynthesis